MNKEEIEEYTLANLREHCIKTMQFSNKNSNTYKEHELVLKTIDDNISLKEYIEQLERIIKTMSKEQTHKQDEYCSHYCNIFIEHEQLENKVKEQEELNDKYLQKLVYALTPTTHVLDYRYNNAFKKIIAENIDSETCKIRRKLKECWGIDKY